MSAELAQTEADTDVEYTPEYGDRFRNRQKDEMKVVHDVRDGNVTFTDGSTETVADLREAVEDIHFAWEPAAVGDGKFEGAGYGDY